LRWDIYSLLSKSLNISYLFNNDNKPKIKKGDRMKKILIIFLIIAMVLLSSCATIKNWFIAKPNISEEENISYIPFQPENKSAKEEVNASSLEESKKEEVIATIKAKEGDLVSLDSITSRIKDPDGDKLTFTYSKPFDKEGKWQTDIGDHGERIVTITASDGVNTVDFKVRVIVEIKDEPPIVEKIDDITVKEGEKIVLDVNATDPEGKPLIITYSGWMSSKEKVTGYNDSGVHYVDISVSDGRNVVRQRVKITVLDVNRKPIINLESDNITIKETELAKILFNVSDPDGDDVKVTFSKPFNARGEWQTKEGDAGTYKVKITAFDGTNTVIKEVTVNVKMLNYPPVIEDIKNIVVNENESVVINVSAYDPENQSLSYEINDTRFKQEGNVFVWKTSYEDAGVYSVKVTVSDGKKESFEEVNVTVKDVNRPPVFVP